MECAPRGGEMILNALRVALRIDSGIIILICISAKPAGLAEMLFFTGGVVAVNCICNSDRPLTIAAPLVKMRLERSAERDKREILK